MSDRSKAVEKRLKRQAAIRQKVERALKDTEGAFTNIGVEKDPFDLPDIKAERVGQKRAASLAMLNNRWPELPSAKVSFELHVPEIAEVHIAEFEAALELAVAIDVVANKMLRNRESYNAYLQEFDNYIADCASNIKKHLTELKNLSKDEMLSSERPAKTLFKIGTLRGMQIHSCYAEADTALRVEPQVDARIERAGEQRRRDLNGQARRLLWRLHLHPRSRHDDQRPELHPTELRLGLRGHRYVRRQLQRPS